MSIARQAAAFVVNQMLTLDMAANCLLLGRPGETISHRVARLRLYGGPRSRRVGCIVCNLLSRLFWFMHRDHCAWALDMQSLVGTELWRWSK